MQIAAAIPPTIAMTKQTVDVVSPNRLFQLGRLRIEGAIDRLEASTSGDAPDAMSTVLAMHQVEAGIGAFGSVLVPSSPFMQRRRAASAIDQSREALSMLRHYHSDVHRMGEGPLSRDDLRPASLLMLDQSIERLSEAAAIATTAARQG